MIRLSVYIPTGVINAQAGTSAKRQKVIDDLKAYRIEHAFLEVYRGGEITDTDLLRALRDDCRAAGIEVSAGIMPVQGRDPAIFDPEYFETGLSYGSNSRVGFDFCYSQPATARLLARMTDTAASLFDEFIIDDALMTMCTCRECIRGRGEQSWQAFRREQLFQVAREHLVEVGKRANPGFSLIIKFPQWYDRLHCFGYDAERASGLFDKTWIGVETRDPLTPHYGYVPQYEAYVNVRWHSALSGKLSGAWFDYLDCDEHLFVEQARQAVLGGIRSLTIFHYGAPLFAERRRFLDRLMAELPELDRLSETAPSTEGIVCVKPPNSEALEDGYLFDALGMIGLPVQMTAILPDILPAALFATAHLAETAGVSDYLQRAVDAGGTVFMTPSFLFAGRGDDGIRRLAGMGDDGLVAGSNWTSQRFIVEGQEVTSPEPVTFRYDLKLPGAEIVVRAQTSFLSSTVEVPVLACREAPGGGRIVIVNTHGISESDYRLDEPLLVPEPLQLPTWPDQLVRRLQRMVIDALGFGIQAAPGVALYPRADGRFVVENFNDETVACSLFHADAPSGVDLEVPARGLSWS